MNASGPTKAILFDLDDTLSDHIGCVRAGLATQQQRYADLFGQLPLHELEAVHSEILEATHVRMLAGEISPDAARVFRTQQFFAHYGVELTDDEAEADYRQFRIAYDQAHDVVVGSRELLAALANDGFRLGVITNNLEAEQHTKLRKLRLFDHFEMLAISEEVGVPKPDPKIFEVALDRMKLDVGEVVMVGDSLTSDIAGALGVGMPCVWLDRLNLGADAAPPEVDAVIASDWSDLDASLAAITIAGANRGSQS